MVEEFAFDNTEERRKTRQNGAGWIEVIVGSMFSGKSEELIRRLRRAQIARQKVQVFKPKIDDRYSIEQIASHSGMTHVSKPVMTAKELLDADRSRTRRSSASTKDNFSIWRSSKPSMSSPTAASA